MMSQSVESKVGLNRFLFMCLILGILIAALRMAFLPNILIGEEGTFAYLVIGPTPVIHGLDAALAGRIDGIDRLIFPEHNILMYKFLDVAARWVGQMLPLCRDGSIECTTIEARAPFLVLFLLGTTAAIVAVRKWLAFDRPLTLAVQLLLLLYVTSAPLVVGGSIQPQIDGSLGVLVLGVSAAFLLASDPPYPTARIFWALLAGIALVFGKNEWALALAGVVCVVLALAVCFSVDLRLRRWDFAAAWPTFRVCGIVLLGVAAGQALNYLYSPEAYPATFAVMRRVDAMKLSALDQLRRTWDLSYPIFLTCGAALALLALRLRHYCLHHPGVLIVAGWGAAIVCAYGYSGWYGDGLPRYYCPAGILALIVLVCLVRDFHLSRMTSVWAALGLVAGIGFNIASLAPSYARGLSISSAPGANLESVKSGYSALAKAYTGTAIFEGAPIGIYYRNVDWVARDLGEEGAVLLARRYRPDAPTNFLKPPQ
jgi:hypothetical protein